ncbi:MAG: hypothetical protein A3A51_00910 [Candidatus Levybacteria bacterium RIFCSPLOWO2_01_FULL_39_10]|nr:MAG: hypothetical protein A3A51_00910 [Candidatus Levybacteria bacterium RIFCSPLOWO2_01_FULL_39_10]
MLDFLKDFFTPLTNSKAIGIIFVVGVIVFTNGLFNGFVLDDISQIIDNSNIHSITNFFSFFTGSTFYGGGGQLIGVYYKPITLGVYSLLYSIFGAEPFWFHLFQLILHITNVSILFLVLRRFFKSPTSLILSLIFLIHPINSESVYYISAIQDVLFFFFGIVGLWLIINYKSDKYLLFAGISLFLSLLSKESGVLFIVISIIYTFLFNKKLSVKTIVISIIISIVYGFLRVDAIGLFSNPLNAPINNLNLIERIVNIPLIIFFYLRTFFFPFNLASSYHWINLQIDFLHLFLPLTIELLLLLTLCLIGIHLYRKYPIKYLKYFIFFALWALIGISIHLQIIPLDYTVAERWFYFPLIGFIGIFGVLFEVLNLKKIEKWKLLIIVAIILLLATRTIMRSFDWKDEFILSIRDIQTSKSAYDLYNGISAQYSKENQYSEAKIYAEKSIEIYPYVSNYLNLGVAYLGLGEYQKAKESYFKALEFGDYYKVYENLGGLALVFGEKEENIYFLKKSLLKFPQNESLWLYLSILQYGAGNIADAKAAIAQAKSINNNSPQIDYVYLKIMSNEQLDLEFTTN